MGICNEIKLHNSKNLGEICVDGCFSKWIFAKLCSSPIQKGTDYTFGSRLMFRFSADPSTLNKVSIGGLMTKVLICEWPSQ